MNRKELKQLIREELSNYQNYDDPNNAPKGDAKEVAAHLQQLVDRFINSANRELKKLGPYLAPQMKKDLFDSLKTKFKQL
ncbi:MAG: hypothetical protein M0R17_10540 [Candidatus Omnitrophica bacterium]|jgi:hypothetical protein|nr:hypothetical protein [Candidatus Omnitrophota bacterium]